MLLSNDPRQKAMRYMVLADLLGEAVCGRGVKVMDAIHSIDVLDNDPETKGYALSLMIQKCASDPKLAAQLAIIIVGLKPTHTIMPIDVSGLTLEMAVKALEGKS